MRIRAASTIDSKSIEINKLLDKVKVSKDQVKIAEELEEKCRTLELKLDLHNFMLQFQSDNVINKKMKILRKNRKKDTRFAANPQTQDA